MNNRIIILLLGVAALLAFTLSGCDTSADRELKRAEEALNKALRIGADANATEDYVKAEGLLVEAQERAQKNEIAEARRLAIESKIIAEDAYRKAEERQKIIEHEMEKIGR
ncbi:MAG: DUF4398 domain-containing protein [Calditrichaeota bacterium]|nr:DUF4398 domain-containing protein [Calditrichota bacterium]